MKESGKDWRRRRRRRRRRKKIRRRSKRRMEGERRRRSRRKRRRRRKRKRKRKRMRKRKRKRQRKRRRRGGKCKKSAKFQVDLQDSSCLVGCTVSNIKSYFPIFQECMKLTHLSVKRYNRFILKEN